jgi:hypothetical protein
MPKIKKRNPFKKLLDNCKMNGIYQKADGTWTINSSTNRRRMEKTGSSVGGAAGTNSKEWKPAKVLITAEDLEKQWEKQGKVCFWLNIPIDLELLYSDHPDWYPKHPAAASVDKIDDSKDYTPDNIVITCRFANFGRNIYPYDKMLTFVEVIREGLK